MYVDEGGVDESLPELDDPLVEESRTVRPYTLTRGRTRPGQVDLPLEALVRGVGPAGPGDTAERRRILELTGTEILSVVELSAHLSLPLGVVRVLVGDLVADGLVVVHSGTPDSQTPAARQLEVLESVLNGISSL
jgi:hypothetical protein